MNKKDKLIIDLINKMFQIAGHEVYYEDIKNRKDAWYEDWTMSMKEYEQWREYGIFRIRKELRYTKTMAEKEMGMIGLMWGLKFSD